MHRTSVGALSIIVTSRLSVARLQTPATPHLDAHVFNAQQRPSPPESLPNNRVLYPPQYGLRVDPSHDYLVSDGTLSRSGWSCPFVPSPSRDYIGLFRRGVGTP
jgi:hypothetical protein